MSVTWPSIELVKSTSSEKLLYVVGLSKGIVAAAPGLDGTVVCAAGKRGVEVVVGTEGFCVVPGRARAGGRDFSGEALLRSLIAFVVAMLISPESGTSSPSASSSKRGSYGDGLSLMLTSASYRSTGASSSIVVAGSLTASTPACSTGPDKASRFSKTKSGPIEIDTL